MRRLTTFATAAALALSFAHPAPAAQAAASANLGTGQYELPFAAVHYASTVPPVVGNVISFAGDRLVMDMLDGSVRTFLMSPSGPGAEDLLTKGNRLAVTVDTNGKVAFVAVADQRTTATVTSVTKAAVTFKLQNGRTVTLPRAQLGSLHDHVTPGMPVIFTTHDGGYTSEVTSAARVQ